MKILIVDDSETLRVQLRRDLESKSYAVVEAMDGVDGIAKVSQFNDIKLIITDVNMPRMDGLTMASKVHDIPENKNLPIIVMTTEMSADLKQRGKAAGVLAWVTKPYVAEKLLQVVAKIVTK